MKFISEFSGESSLFVQDSDYKITKLYCKYSNEDR